MAPTKIGCLPPGGIDDAAADIYRAGIHQSDLGLRIRLVAVGRDRSDDLAGPLSRGYPASAVLRTSPPPQAPSLSLAGFRLVIADHALGLPVLRALSLCTCRVVGSFD